MISLLLRWFDSYLVTFMGWGEPWVLILFFHLSLFYSYILSKTSNIFLHVIKIPWKLYFKIVENIMKPVWDYFLVIALQKLKKKFYQEHYIHYGIKLCCIKGKGYCDYYKYITYNLNIMFQKKRTHTCISQNIQMPLKMSNKICRTWDFDFQLST